MAWVAGVQDFIRRSGSAERRAGEEGFARQNSNHILFQPAFDLADPQRRGPVGAAEESAFGILAVSSPITFRACSGDAMNCSINSGSIPWCSSGDDPFSDAAGGVGLVSKASYRRQSLVLP
ncbi:hypothetical protein [Streptosporangium sp. NPDC001681]|uniref:hypothetical protein n=1 Tax=Streptosporangium sp. NPDC001681 TaxID=3154395 RepID=UPI00332FD426